MSIPFKEIAVTVASLGKQILDSEDGKKLLLGTYTDGTTKSVKDAISDEIMSPATRDRRLRDIESRRALIDDATRAVEKEQQKKKKKHKKKKNKCSNKKLQW